MHLLPNLASFLGIVAVVYAGVISPPGGLDVPNKVKIRGISLLGSGCPERSADVQIDATGSLFEATFSEYQVQTGPGIPATDWRKNCKLTINMEFDSGFQFSVVNTDMIGFAELPTDINGRCVNTFSFTGNGAEHVDYKMALKGPYSGDFDLQSHPGIFSWSPCGGSTAILNMNTACNIDPSTKPALIAVDHISSKLTVKIAVQWQRCPKH